MHNSHALFLKMIVRGIFIRQTGEREEGSNPLHSAHGVHSSANKQRVTEDGRGFLQLHLNVFGDLEESAVINLNWADYLST